jgi:dolichol-phosphate mannosyltransferase
MALLSIVLPAYNEEQNISHTSKRLSSILEENGIDYELVFISDGSKDGTYEEIVKEAASNPRIKGAEFSRNFGKEAGIFAGLELTCGDAVIVMDCDLQHPPEVIPEMWRLWQSGVEVVEGIKTDRGNEGLLHKAFAGLFYRIMSGLMKMDMNSSSDFKLLDRKVVKVLLELPERNTFFRALTFWAGFRTESVYYEVQERQYGSSKWSFSSLVRYAITNATSFSTLPLQLVTIMGCVSILFSIVLALQTIIRYLTGNAVEGFTTVILLILIIGGFLMISLGIIGHYIARIYEEVKGRPRYIISRTTDNVPEAVRGRWGRK